MAIVGEAHVVVRAITVGFKQDVEKSLRDVNGTVRQSGNKIGKDFNDSLRKGMGGGGKDPFASLTRSADAARKKFNTLIKTGYLLGPALSGGAGAISALVSGLFAVGAAAGSAAPALAVLPSLLVAIAQAGIVAKLAFAGVGKAISALSKQKTSGGGGGGDNSKQIADARKALARAYQSAADQMANADKRVMKAQQALNDAYKKGAESLQQLGFDAEDAAIAQSKAALELEQAKETLARVQDLPPNSRARREAELAFAEADLNYRQAVDRSNDLAKAQEYAAQTGIEGTQEVLDAKQELADAEEERAKTERDNAQSIADAQENVKEALKGTAAAGGAAANALAGLPQSAQDFVREFMKIKPELDKIREAAADGLFPHLITALHTLSDGGLFKAAADWAYKTADAIGTVAEKFANMLTQSDNMAIMDRVFGDANITIISNLGDAFVSLGDAALKILDAVAPLAVEFSAWIKTITDNFDKYITFTSETGKLSEYFQNASDKLKIIGGMLKDTFTAFFELGKGASDAGVKIIKAFDDAMVKLHDWAKAGNESGALQEKFDNIADSVIAMGGFLADIVKVLFDLGSNPGVKSFFDNIRGIPEILGGAANTFAGTGGAIGTFLTSMATTIATFSDSGSIENFFGVLTKALDVINAIFNNDTVMNIFQVLAAVKGISLAFGVIGSVGKFAGENLVGAFSPMVGIVKGTSFTQWGDDLAGFAGKMESARGSGMNFTKGLGNLTAGFQLLGEQIWISMAPLLPWIALGAAIAAAMYLMWENSEILRESVKTLVDAVGTALNDAMTTINTAIQDVMPNVSGLSDLFKKMGDWVGTYIVPIFQFIFVNAIHAIADVIALVIRVVAAFFKAFTDPIGAVKDLLSAFATFFHDRLVGIFKDAKEALGKIPLFDHLISGAKGAFNGIARAWNNTIGKFTFKVPSWVPSFGGKTFDMPNIPELAQGGVIRPTPGGTIARIAEAGRAERVEPLDSQGLSARDRAIIAQLSGPQTSANLSFNIHPSEGMDELALASMVSRKVAWNMQRGA